MQLAGCMVVVVCLAGCGRIAFDARGDAARGDTPSDACAGAWQLLSNGGFETGDLTSWSTMNVPLYGIGEVVASPAAEGTSSVRMTSTQTVFAGFSLHQTVQVITGTRYVLSGYLDASQLTTSQSLYLDTNDIPGGIDVAAVRGAPGWQFVSDVFTVQSGTAIVVRIVHDGDLDPSRMAFADEIALTPEADFVPPSCP